MMGPLAFAQLICMQHDNNIESLWLAAYKFTGAITTILPLALTPLLAIPMGIQN